MKTVNFGKIKEGDLVQVPRTQFAPMRHGWNGWLFSEAVVIEKGIGKKSGKAVIVVDMEIDAGKNQYKTIRRTFLKDYVFQTGAIERAKRILEADGIKSKEQFKEYIESEDVTGADWITFLIDKGFIFEKEKNEHEGI